MRTVLPLSRPQATSYDARALLRWVLRKLEEVYVVVSLVLFTGAFGTFLGAADADVAEGNPVMQALFASIYLIALILLLWRPNRFVQYLFAERYLLFVLLLALLSIGWAAVPELTIRRSIALAGTTLFGVYLASRFDLNQLLRLIGWACLIVVVSSLIVALALPNYGVMQGTYTGAWRGVLGHKNSLGRLMTFSILVFLLLLGRRPYRWPFLLGLGIAMPLLLLSQSATALVVLLASTAILPLLRVLRWRNTLLLGVAMMAVIGAAFGAMYLWTNADVIVASLGRDITLTGRTQLWQLVLNAIGERPWFGYGYSSFWNGWNPEATYIWFRLSWEAPHAHNGALDMLLDLGLVGLGLFGVSLWQGISRGVKGFRLSSGSDGYWPLTFFTYLLLANFTENTFLVRNNIFWALQVALTLQLAVWTKQLARRKPMLGRRQQKGGAA